jgi:hypothetical protein
MPNYSIEARSLDLAGVASHNFWVLRDEKGQPLAELHGLATDRESGKYVPIGTDEEKHSLRAWHFPHDADYANSLGVRKRNDTYIQEGQGSMTVLTADKDEVMARWNAAVAAKEPLNALDRNYPNYGFKVFQDTVNSNSTYRTFGDIMGVPVRDFPWKVEPGIENRMVDQKEIQRLRTHEYPVLDEPSIKVDGQYKSLGKHRAEAERAVVEPAVREQQGQFDARDPSHQGHTDYARIRQQLASSIDDPQKLDNVSASAYREMVANPLVKQADYVGIHNGHAVVSYAPFGLEREPMFNAHIELAKAQDQPAEQSLGQAQRLSEAQAQAAVQQQSQAQEQSGPALGIGARSV